MNNGMLVCLVAGFVPMSSQSKEEAVRVAVGSSRCYRHRTAAWEGILSSNRKRPTDRCEGEKIRTKAADASYISHADA